jgi:hypothetical protein
MSPQKSGLTALREQAGFGPERTRVLTPFPSSTSAGWGSTSNPTGPLALSAPLTAPGLNRDRATGGAFVLVSRSNS